MDANRPEMATRDRAAQDATERPPLSPEAQRALQEATARRAALEAAATPPEQGGRSGLEPVRYGDWEVKGIASDF